MDDLMEWLAVCSWAENRSWFLEGVSQTGSPAGGHAV